MTKRTLIQGGWVVACRNGRHELIENGVVVFEGGRIEHVGHAFEGHVDERIDARGRLVSPGFIDAHVHAGHRAGHKLMTDTGRPEMMGSTFYESLPKVLPSARREMSDETARRFQLQAEFTVAELLRNGVTTFVEAGSNFAEFGDNDVCLELLIDHVDRLGARAWFGPAYQSNWLIQQADGRRRRVHDEAIGEQQFRQALDFLDRADGRAGGRVRAMLMPCDTDTCSLEMLQRTAQIAAERNLAVAIHCGYTVWEFYDVVSEHGCTPVELLHRAGLLRPMVNVGHCALIAGNGSVQYPGGRDLDLLGGSGATVSHCPVTIARRGSSLRDWARYREAGIPIALGSDSFPRDMIMTMRAASFMGKVMSANLFTATCAEVFEAATLAGAQMLGRGDLGRLEPGACADIVIIDLDGRDSLRHTPYRDPIKTLVECGVGDDVETVFVDGRLCVQGRRVLGVDLDGLRAQVQADAEHLWSCVHQWDALGRDVEQKSPMSFPVRRG